MKPRKSSQAVFEIRVEGVLGEVWADWFADLSIREEFDGELNCPVSVLYGPVSDQSSLHGVLAKINNLNLDLISVKRIPQEVNHEDDHFTLKRD